MRAHKSYLAAHPSCWSEDPNTTCPGCRSGAETFEHAVPPCSARSSPRDWYWEPTLRLQADSPLWKDQNLLHVLSQYLCATKTGFPPEMAPSPLPSQTPSPSPSPLSFKFVLILMDCYEFDEVFDSFMIFLAAEAFGIRLLYSPYIFTYS